MTEARVNARAVTAAFSEALLRASRGVSRTLNQAGARFQRDMVKRFVAYGSGDPIQTRTGALRRSVGWRVRGEGLNAELRLFSQGTAYARAQEYGATIKPKRKRYLTIPLPDALTPSGAQKGGKRLVHRGNKYATADGQPTFIFKSKKGSLLVAERQSRKLLYVLKKQVKLEPRLGFRETFRDSTIPFIDHKLREAVS